jgi:hypothetical protein
MNKVFMAAFLCCVLVLAAIVPAYAQLPGTVIRVMIPFDFIVRSKVLPAGEYDLKRIGDSAKDLVIQNEASHRSTIFETDPVEARRSPSKATLVFHRYGDTYFLAQIWTPDNDTGRELFPSHQERRLSRDLASNNNSPAETVDVAAN